MAGKSADSCPDSDGLGRLSEVTQRVSATRSRLAKCELLAELLLSLASEEKPLAVNYLCGTLPQGRLGVGPSTVSALWNQLPDPDPALAALSLSDLDRRLAEFTQIQGKGSKRLRMQALREILASTTRGGQEFFLRLLGGGLRQGALAGVMEMAVAKATGVNSGLLRRALTLTGSLVEAASIALEHGDSGLSAVQMRVLTPLSPMLASPAQDLEEAYTKWECAFWELKLDGARIQVHRQGDEVRVFSRSLREVTASLPEVVELAREFRSSSFVLDGEVVALAGDGRCRPFQETMRRFGRRAPSRELLEELPLRAFFFDLLLENEEETWERPFRERRERLVALVGEYAVSGCRVTSQEKAALFLKESIDGGFEGLMVKSLDGLYEAGRRGSQWLKLKPYHTLDLVVVAAEWGSGRRRGWLSNLHLAARAGDAEGFVMLGKTFKGLSDEILQWQTQRLLELEVERQGHVVRVKPELVVEIAFNDLQQSPQYEGGLALRFARLKGYRTDKGVEEADSMTRVWELYHQSGPGTSSKSL